MKQEPINVGTRKQMFIDQCFIAQSDGIELHVNPPALRGPVLKGERPWEAGWISAPYALIQDGNTLKLWYQAYPPRAPNAETRSLGPGTFCYATSADGVHWERPNLGVFEYEGSKENNIISHEGGFVFLDEQAPADKRYKLLRSKSGDLKEGGLYIATSSDGIHWTDDPQRLFPFYPDSNNQVFYDPRIDKYVAYVRSWAPLRKVARTEMDDLMQPWPYEEGVEPSTLWGEGSVPPPGYELPQAISYDELDPPETDLYTPAVSIYPWAENVYVSFTTPYRHFPEPPEGKWMNDGLVEVQLAVSRDGVRFERPDRSRAYIPLGIRGGPQGGSIYMVTGLARLGDEIYHYYGAYAHSHGEYFGYEKLEGIGVVYLAVQRLDGFMSADAAYTGGWLVTPPLTFAGGRLELNINCGATGHARVELRDEHDVPIKGFSAEECDLIRGNHVHFTATWKGSSDVSALAGKPVRLRFVMRNSKLFAFQVR